MRIGIIVGVILFAFGSCINVNTRSSQFYDSPPNVFFANAVQLNIEDNRGRLAEGKHATRKSFLCKSAVMRAFGDSRYFKTVSPQGEYIFKASVNVAWEQNSFSLFDGISTRIFFLIPYRSNYPITVNLTLKDRLGNVVVTSTQHDSVVRITAWALTPVGLFFFKRNSADEELIYRLIRKALIDCRLGLNQLSGRSLP
jgi:hypothetical protein